MSDLHPLYKAASEAEEAWRAELVRQFGKHNAGTMRYLPEGKAGPVLGPLCEAYQRAINAWLEEMERFRNEQKITAT